MKKKITLLLLFVITSLSSWSQTISFTEVPASTPIGTILTVSYEYTIASEGQVSCGISLFDDWTYISYVNGASLNPAPAGTNVTGTFNILIPGSTKLTSSLTGKQNYKVILELKNASGTWLAGDYSVQNYNFTEATEALPSISVTTLPNSTQAGSNLIVNYKYTAAAAGKITAVVTKNGGVNDYDFISTVAFTQLDPAVAGTDVTGSFTLAIPASTTPTASLTGNENYRIILELKDASNNWLAGNYDTVNYNITAGTAPYISVTSIPTSTEAGTNLIINYKYTASATGKISAVVTKNGGVNDYDFISTVAFDELDPAAVGTNVTGSITVAIPADTTPSASLTGNENYRVTLELKDASNNFVAGDYSNINYTISPSLGTYDFNSDRFSVYPNPVDNVLKISNTGNLSKASFRISNVSGQTVQKSNSRNKEGIDVSSLKTGIYLLSVDTDKGGKQIKFIKK